MSSNWPLLENWVPTRNTLHAYASILGGIRRALTPPHPRWWHASLQVVPEGLTTGAIPGPTPEVADFRLTLDLRSGGLVVDTAEGERTEIDLVPVASQKELGARVLRVLRDLGIEIESDPPLWKPGGTEAYDAEAAKNFLRALLRIQDGFEAMRSELGDETGPVQLWPHHFDLSFEWFGTRLVAHEQDGSQVESPAQIGFGFSSGDENHSAPYVYALPWPFESSLSDHPLPDEARWMSSGWFGGLLPYASIRKRGVTYLHDFCWAVYRIASPSLTR